MQVIQSSQAFIEQAQNHMPKKHPDLSFPHDLSEDAQEKIARQNPFDAMLEHLYQTGKAICQVIDDFQPDLVIPLAHGAWVVLWSVEAYWKSNKGAQAFPPLQVMNLGREKIARYEPLRKNLPCVHISSFIADYADDEEVGYFLSWLGQQRDWIEQFKQKTQAAIRTSPERILILDDAIYEGVTYRLAIGLTEAVFPKATVRFINGNVISWRTELAYPWLEEQIPGWHEKHYDAIVQALYYLSPGTEDSRVNPFAWKPITRRSRIVKTLSAFLPAERWLELSGWMKDTLQAYVQERSLQDISFQPPPQPLTAEDLRDLRKETVIKEITLTASEMILKYVWQHGSINVHEAMELLKHEKALTSRLLRKQWMRGKLITNGPPRARRYVLPPEVYTPKEMLPPSPPLDTFWVMPNRLLTGDSLNTQEDVWLTKQLRMLVEKGVTRILDVDIYNVEDGPEAAQALQASGTSIAFEFVRLPARRHMQGMGEVLSAIDQALQQSEVVYLSVCSLEESAAIAACYLVQQGATGPQALAQVNQMRQSGFEPWHTYPKTRPWRQLVLRWARSDLRGISPSPNAPAES